MGTCGSHSWTWVLLLVGSSVIRGFFLSASDPRKGRRLAIVSGFCRGVDPVYVFLLPDGLIRDSSHVVRSRIVVHLVPYGLSPYGGSRIYSWIIAARDAAPRAFRPRILVNVNRAEGALGMEAHRKVRRRPSSWTDWTPSLRRDTDCGQDVGSFAHARWAGSSTRRGPFRRGILPDVEGS